MIKPLVYNDLKALEAFVDFLIQKGHNASLIDDSVVIRHITNKNNNFKLIKQDTCYIVQTICVSPLDYEYTAKCIIYILLAEYNKSNDTSTHIHINFKVDL